MESKIIKHFKGYLIGSTKQTVNLTQVVQLLSHGVFADPRELEYAIGDLNVIINSAEMYHGIQGVNLSATFYKEWDEAEDEYEQRIYQILHYIDYLTPNNIDHIDIPVFTVLKPFTKEQLIDKICAIFYSGIALSEDDIDDFINILIELDALNALSLNQVKNRDVMIKLVTEYELPVTSMDVFVRVVCDQVINTPMFINSKQTYHQLDNVLKNDHHKRDLLNDLWSKFICTQDINRLSKHILRYRKVLLVLRQYMNADGKKTINKLLRLAKKDHIPFKQPVVNRFFSASMDEVKQVLPAMPTFQIIRLFNYGRWLEQQENETVTRFIRIRNGRTKIVETKTPDKTNVSHYLVLLKEELVKRYQEKFQSTTVILPEHLELTLPASAKQCVFGNIPLYSSIPIDPTSIVGIAWSTEADIDLHAYQCKDDRVNHVGWNGRIQSAHSGDMVRLNQYGFAAEYINLDKAFGDSNEPVMVTVNPYNVSDMTPTTFVVSHAKDWKAPKESKNITDSLSNIQVRITLEMSDTADSIGFIYNNRFYFTPDVDEQYVYTPNLGDYVSMQVTNATHTLTIREFLSWMTTDEDSDVEKSVIDLRDDVRTLDKLLELLELTPQD